MQLLHRYPVRLRLNILVAVAGFVTNAALAFISYRLVLQSGGIELLGLWSALVSATFLVRIGDLGLGGAAVRYIAILPKNASLKRARELIDTILLSNLILYMLLAMIGLVVLLYGFAILVGLPPDSEQSNIALQILPILMFGFFVQGAALPVFSVLQGLHHGYIASGLSVMGLLVQMICAVLLIPKFGLAGLAWAMVLQHAITALIGWILVLFITASASVGLMPLNFSRDVFRETLRYGINLQAINIVNGFFEPVAKLLIGRFCGLSTLGTFELAYRTIHILRGAINSAILATIPATADLLVNDFPKASSLYRKMCRLALRAILIFVGIALVGSPLISILWIDKIDQEFITALALISVGVVGNILGAPAYTLGLASGRLRGNFIAAGVALVSLVILVPLAARWHDMAAISATATAMALSGLLVKWLNERILFTR